MILAKGGWKGMDSFLSKVFSIWGSMEVTVKPPAGVTP